MERITQADIDEMRSTGYDRSTIADAQARLDLCKRADELIEQIAAFPLPLDVTIEKRIERERYKLIRAM